MKNKLTLNTGIAILIILHTVGIIGLLSPYQSLFISLTPINLLISLALLIYFQKHKTKRFYIAMVFIMITGFVLEIIGINTGYPFGSYAYGKALGPKLLGTPYMIGVNWFFMAYCGSLVFKGITKSIFVNAIITGIVITLMDYIMEPVAIRLDFWSWATSHIPIQNFITWAIAIFAYALFIYKYIPSAKNPIAKWVLGIQFIFFLTLFIAFAL